MKKYCLSPVLLLLLSFVHHRIPTQSTRVIFQAPMLYPEGIAYDEKAKVFYVSSVTTGAIGKVDELGNYTEFYAEKEFKSSFGLKVDPKSNTLWACISDPNYSLVRDTNTYKKMARVIQLDLTKKTKLRDINLGSFLPGKHFANDLALDNKGNVYLTDSYAPLIYKIEAAGRESVLVFNDIFRSEDVGLNGIVWHPQGFLLVAHSTNACLYKVDIANPSKITKVKTSKSFPGADGLLLDKNLDLILVQNKEENKVFRISSKDNWTTGQVVSETTSTDQYAYPTTATFKEGNVCVLNSKLNELQDSATTPSNEFSIQVAEFKPIK